MTLVVTLAVIGSLSARVVASRSHWTDVVHYSPPFRPVGLCGAVDGSRIKYLPCYAPGASLQIAAVLGGSSCPSEATIYEKDSALGVVCWNVKH